MPLSDNQGPIPAIDELYPLRPPPMKRGPPEELSIKTGPIATGAGFFTPHTGNAGNLFNPPKADAAQSQHRMGPPPVPRDIPCVSSIMFMFSL